MTVTFYSPSKKSLSLSKPKVSLVKTSKGFWDCKLTFQVDTHLHEEIDSEHLFNNHPDLRIDISDKPFRSEASISIEMVLMPMLLTKNVGHEPTENLILEYLSKVNEPEHELLHTENWLTLSVIQSQDSEKIGYQTLWSYINPGFLIEELLETGDVSEALSSAFSSFFQSSFPASLDQLSNDFKNYASDNLQTLDGLFSDLRLGSDKNSTQDVTAALAQEISEIFKASLQEIDPGLEPDEDTISAFENKKDSDYYCIEANQRLSKSQLWHVQQQFFTSQEIEIDGSFNRTNSAYWYGDLICACLQDFAAVTKRHKTDFPVLDKAQPIYVVEVGAGSGRLAHRLLHHLPSLLTHPSLKKLKVTYILTDFVAENLAFWQQHPTLQSFFEQGLLDIALFDLQHPGPITLQRAGETLTAETLTNPLIVIANNVFGCLPQDAYYIESDILHDDLVTLSAPEGADPNPWETLSQLSFRYDSQPVDSERSDIPDILQQYCQTLDYSHILWPTVALQSLDYLRDLAGDRLMVISSDAAYCHEVALQGNGEPVPSVNGYLTFPVNYHALATHAESQGGQALQPQRAVPGFSTQVLLFGDHPTQFRETKATYGNLNCSASEHLDLLLMPLVTEQLDTLSLHQLVAYLQFHHWDVEIFLTCFSALMLQLEAATLALHHDVIQGVHQAWQSYYALDGDPDLAFYLAMVLYTLEDYASAIDYFERSRQSHGDDSSTLYNLAMSHYRLGQNQPAIAYLEKTLAIDPAFAAAQTLMQELR